MLQRSIQSKSKYEFTIRIYPKKTHGFDYEGLKEDFGGQHLEYDPEVSADAAKRMKACLAKYLQ